MRRFLQLCIPTGLLVMAFSATTLVADTYPRQPLDVEHYRFALTLADTTDSIAGEAAVRLRMLQAGVRSVSLDLGGATTQREGKGMTVQSVTVNGAALAFTHTADRLAMTLASPSQEQQRIELVIRYAGVPADGLQIKPNRHGDRTFS